MLTRGGGLVARRSVSDPIVSIMCPVMFCGFCIGYYLEDNGRAYFDVIGVCKIFGSGT